MSYDPLNNVDNRDLSTTKIYGEEFDVWELVFDAIENTGLPETVVEQAIYDVRKVYERLDALIDAAINAQI